jgi:hypothetical protein
LENSDDSREGSSAWENTTNNIQISAKERLADYRWKQRMSQFDEESSITSKEAG